MEGPPETPHTRISITRHPLMMPDDALPSAGAAFRYHPRPAIWAPASSDQERHLGTPFTSRLPDGPPRGPRASDAAVH